MASTTTLCHFPDEVLEQIIHYLSAEHTLLSVQRVSKRFLRLAREPLLWRYHCRTDFRYWDEKHRIGQKFKGDVDDADWRMLYLYRKSVDIRTSNLIDSILSEQSKRVEKTEQISEFGYDAKDTLLRHCRTDASADDVLARRYGAGDLSLRFMGLIKLLAGFTAMLFSAIFIGQKHLKNGTD